MATWVNFKELRQRIAFEDVLRHYGIEIKRKGNQHHGYCPLPNHNGKRNSPSFSANLKMGIFQCFGCGAKGNLLEFAALMEKTDPDNGAAFRTVALNLQEKFCRGTSGAGNFILKPKSEPVESRNTPPIVINPPLDFELKQLDANHPYLFGRGFSPSTITHFGLGFCSRGMLKDRVAIPLSDQDGKLIGYAGRVIDDNTITEENPRYRLPGTRNHNGMAVEFRKTAFLYNGHRIKPGVENLIVVEGFASVWWLHQSGFPHVVATMGSDASEKQVERIVSLVKPSGRVWILPDADEAGFRFVKLLLVEIALHRSVRWVELSEGNQPTDLRPEELKSILPV